MTAAAGETTPRLLGSRRASAAFLAIGALTLAAYALLWLPPLWLWRFPVFTDTNPDIGSILGHDTPGMLRYALLVALPYALYAAGLLLVARVPRRLALRGTVVVGVAAPLILLFAYPAFAADIFEYLLSARLIVAHHFNPYIVPPSAVPGDPYYPPAVWRDLLSNYGPAWLTLSVWPVALAGTHRMLALLLLKSLMVAAHLATGVLVYRIVLRLDASRAPRALLAYLWNPLAIVSFAVDGHNDALMLLCLAAALWLALRGSWQVAFPVLTLGALAKFVPLIFFPVFLLAARRSRASAALGLAASAVLVVAAYWPFWAGRHTFDGVVNQGSLLTSSPASLLNLLVPYVALRPIFGLLFVAGYLLVLRRVKGLPAQCFAIMVLYLMTLSFWTKGWYLTWPLVFGVIAGGEALALSALVTAGAFVASVFWAWMLPMDWWGLERRWDLVPLDVTMGLSLYLPWLLGLAWLRLRGPSESRKRANLVLEAR